MSCKHFVSRWTKNDEPLQSKKRTLIIRSVTEADTGVYKCYSRWWGDVSTFSLYVGGKSYTDLLMLETFYHYVYATFQLYHNATKIVIKKLN